MTSRRARGDLLVLDAPVSGGQAGAVNGTLTIMCGGTPQAFAAAEPVMAAYAKRSGLMGPAGSGQLTKMVNQIAIAGVVEGLAEAVNFALAAGLDAASVFDVIGQGAAQSWQMDNRASTMALGQYDFGFAVDWMRKDLGLVLDEARRLGVTLPGTALVDQFYGDVQRPRRPAAGHQCAAAAVPGLASRPAARIVRDKLAHFPEYWQLFIGAKAKATRRVCNPL